MDKCKKDILYETLNYFSSYNDFLNKNDILFIINHIDMFIQYYNLINNEYVLFLPRTYFYITKEVPSCMGCFIKQDIKDLKCALEEQNVTLIIYEKKAEFLYLMNLINRFHKKNPQNYFIENYIMKIGKILYIEEVKENKSNKYYLLNHFKSKEYYFYENNVLPFTLYKKIKLSNIIQFISLEHYAYKKNEYMLRSFSQIAEELGSIKIHISNNYKREDGKIIKLGLINNNVEHIELNKDKNKIEFDFEYSKNNYINLNEFLLNGKILNENKFLLSKDDYESNIELKYLIHARCHNFIEKYYTQFKSSTLNSKEVSIFLTLKDYHINIENQNIVSEKIETNLQIDFLNLLDHTNLIDGSNIYPLKEGYIYLKQIILKEHDFRKYINFLKAHLHAIQNKYVYLAYDYEYIHDIMKIYYQCIELNFEEKELLHYISKYWENQNEWYHFTLLRDIILLGNDNLNDKIHFITFQYINIFKNKYYLLKNIEDNLNNIIDEVIDEHITERINKYNEIDVENNNIDYSSDEEIKRDKEKLLKNVLKKGENNILQHNESMGKDEYIDKFTNFINNTINDTIDNENINYIDNIKNRLNGYIFLEDSVIINNKEEEHITELYFKHIKTKSFKNNLCNNDNNNFDIKIFKERLKNNQFYKKIIELIIKGIKGSFYYENGISNNILNNKELKNTINNVIKYYFQDEINILQSTVLHNMFGAKNYEMIHIIQFIEELLNKYFSSKNIIHMRKEKRMKSIEPNNKAIHDSIQLHIDDNSSPKIMDKKEGNLCILDEIKNIFIKFVYKEVQKINIEQIPESDLLKKMDEKFQLNYLLTNYRKHRIFYTYNDYELFVKELKKVKNN